MDNTQKLLTVVVPTYNMEKYLPYCLDSLTADAVPDSLEVIVVNDGSKDRSLEIMRDYERRRPDIVRVIDKPNGNYGSCVNAGLQVATGKYFRILDADDRFDTAALVKLLTYMETCDTDLVVTLIAEEVFKEDVKVAEQYHPFLTVEKNHIYNIDDFDVKRYVKEEEFRMHGMTYKTEVLRKSGLQLPGGISYTDTLYFYHPFPYIKDLIVYDLYLYYYRVGRENQTMDPQVVKKGLADMAIVLNNQLKDFDSLPPPPSLLLANMKALLFVGGIHFFLYILKMQSGISKEHYPLLHEIIHRMNKHDIQHKYFRKWYFRIWKYTESSRMLDISLRIRSLTKR